ncbi:lantibiotic dehydratase family protein [Aquimarina gracilis]|uniref:Lantibiotic dehydratase family protein n=1 Tax=Aquimarina gracilis TaxID=874422 RepID=A0ABU5ZZH3_9FLAO|nr:lantibiotic dehydratase family protein [Aquimarina gracilis]MEB3347279.1 lantibiotic dehydratase family protein [Aquimarina gracilis]
MIYKNFPKYVLRAPLFSFSFYQKLTQDTILEEEALRKVCEDKIIKEAIFLASPALYSEFEKWLRGDIKDRDKSDRMMYSVLKYISRMSSRCTPFGLFAGTSVGEFSDETTIELQDKSKNERHTRLDMNYLVALSQDIVKNEAIRDQLLFFPNTSIYKTGHQLRYVEYTYVNSRRIHHIVGVEHSDYLQEVIDKAQQGALLSDLAAILVDDEITIEEATDFIHQLVESQLLISELEPSVSGPEFMDQILPVLRKLKGTQELITELEKTQATLEKLDSAIGNEAEHYIALSESLKKLDVGFELKYMFQTDMSLSPKVNTLEKKWLYKVQKALTLLNRITLPPKETLISSFKSAFYERYEEREVPLSKALDVELGVGFLQNQGLGDVSNIIDDLVLPQKNNGKVAREIRWSPVDAILQKKLVRCIEQNQNSIILTDKDFEDFEENWDDLPDTISTMTEIVKIDGEEKIILSSAGGSSAANLLGRFCHGDEALNTYTQAIIDIEQQENPDKILAEIVHLPESRVGNILMRPAFRKYEIPYLAKSILDTKNQLTLDDLMVSATVHGGVKLRSKKLNKEVIPHLTNAHNYSGNALPIYQFLANMQTQNLRSGIGFNWGPLANEYDFLPRVEYKGVIFSAATWNIKSDEIKPMLDTYNAPDQLTDRINTFVVSKKLPQYILLIDGDNELLVNTRNITSMKMLLETIKKRNSFKIKEFLHAEEGIIKEKGEAYTNQVIFSFYNEKKLKNTTAHNE